MGAKLSKWRCLVVGVVGGLAGVVLVLEGLFSLQLSHVCHALHSRSLVRGLLEKAQREATEADSKMVFEAR